MADTEELPRTIVRRVVKGKLAELIKDMADKKEISVHKEAIVAFSESAKVFIHYLSATANDICRESKRQTISAEDVLKAIEEIDFLEFLEPLKAALEEFRKDNAIKKSEAKEKGQGKKRKSEVANAEQENVEAADKATVANAEQENVEAADKATDANAEQENVEAADKATDANAEQENVEEADKAMDLDFSEANNAPLLPKEDDVSPLKDDGDTFVMRES